MKPASVNTFVPAAVQPGADPRVAVGVHHVVEPEPQDVALRGADEGTGRQPVPGEQEDEVAGVGRLEAGLEAADVGVVGAQEVEQERCVRGDRHRAEVAVRAELLAQEPDVQQRPRRRW